MTGSTPRRSFALLLALTVASAAHALRVPEHPSGTVADRAFAAPELRAAPTIRASSPGLLPASVAREELAFRARYGADPADWNVSYDVRAGSPALVSGRGIPWLPGANGLTWAALALDPGERTSVRAYLDATARAFVREQAAWLRVDERELVLRAEGIQHPADFLWYLRLDWAPQGIAVEDAYVILRLNHGNLVQLGVKGIASSPASAAAALDASAAEGIARAFAGADPARDLTVRGPELAWLRTTPDPAQRDAWGGPFGRGYDLRLVWETTIRRAGDPASWRIRVDARTGAVLELADATRYGQIHGGVYQNGCISQSCEQDRPLGYADYAAGSFSNQAGVFPGNSGTSTLTGSFVDVVDDCGAVSASTSTGDLDFGGGAGKDCQTPGSGGAGNTHASRSSYYHLGLINQKGRAYFPSNSWLAAPLQDHVNQLFLGLFRLCNAFWDGNAVNFFQSGDPDFFGTRCNNSGEIPGIFLHEWGHGMDENDGNGITPDIGSSETYGDVTSLLQTHDSCIGPSFLLSGNCGGYGDPCTSCSGVRDIDYAKHQGGQPHTPANFTASCPTGQQVGPCGMEAHCESYISSEAMYDLGARDLVSAGFDTATAWQIADRLWYLTRPTAGSAFTCSLPSSDGCAAENLYSVLVVADDCDGNLANGTPHMLAIHGAMDRHAIACNTPAPQNQTSCCASLGAPSATGSSGTNSVTITWGAVGGAAGYAVYRNDQGCDQGYTQVGSTTATTFTDTNVVDGTTYYYRVQAIGATGACFGPLSNCVTVTPGGGSCTLTLSPSSLPAAIVGIAYSQTITAAGGTGPYTFAVTSGSLPPGLALAAGGLLSGTPTGAGSFPFTVTATDSAACTGSQAYTLAVTTGSGAGNFVVGKGLGAPNTNEVKVYTGAGSFASVDFFAYSAGQWGVNVAAGDISGAGLDQMVTGPGPGAVFGPHVRGFQRDGSAMGKVSFYAYGTLKYGVNPEAGALDADVPAEMLTGAGPGAVFGPHVRGFNFDGGSVAPISKISFFAYQTLKYGVNVATGSIDGDNFAELVTGAGPGTVFAPQVRGFDYDANSVTAIAKVNFLAFTTTQWGVNVAAGDVDGDGFAEILAAPGPGSGAGFEARLAGFDYDGAGVAAAPGLQVTMSSTTRYGARVGAGDLTGDVRAEVIGGKGRDAAADATVHPYDYSGNALTPRATFDPFPGSGFGVNVAGGALGY